MALSEIKLKNNLLTWLNNSSLYLTTSDSMTAFSNAYENYALDAIDISGDSPLLLKKADMLSILNTLSNSDTASSAATKFTNAIIAFWTNATFILLTPPVGTIIPEISAIVTIPPNYEPLKTNLETEFNKKNPTDTNLSKAESFADIFHTATLTTIVTCTGTIITPPFFLGVPGNII